MALKIRTALTITHMNWPSVKSLIFLQQPQIHTYKLINQNTQTKSKSWFQPNRTLPVSPTSVGYEQIPRAKCPATPPPAPLIRFVKLRYSDSYTAVKGGNGPRRYFTGTLGVPRCICARRVLFILPTPICKERIREAKREAPAPPGSSITFAKPHFAGI